LGEASGGDDIESMRHVVCVLLGHLFEEPTTILGFTMRRCSRCGKTEPSG
jgi:hypothetical protein